MPEIATLSLVNDANLQAYYRFSSGSDTADSSSNSNTLTHVNAPSNTAGVFGNGMDYNGSNQYSHSNNPTGLDGMTATSLTLWFNAGTLDTGSSNARYIATYATRSGLDAQVIQLYTIGDGSNAQIRALIGDNDGGGRSTTITGSTNLSTSTVYQVTITYDGSNINLYLNGSTDASPVALAGATLNTPDANNDSIFIGAIGTINESTIADYFDGLVDDVAFFDRSLTAAEVRTIFSGELRSVMIF